MLNARNHLIKTILVVTHTNTHTHTHTWKRMRSRAAVATYCSASVATINPEESFAARGRICITAVRVREFSFFCMFGREDEYKMRRN